MADDDDEEGFGGLYENGHWVWDEYIEGLVYISDLLPKYDDDAALVSTKVQTEFEFRDDVDLIGEDVKDIVLFTAPAALLSPMLINILHVATTERLVRALIFYCQYYFQIADDMARRKLELESKIRTPDCEIIENEYRNNLADLRVLVAKEYFTMLIGGEQTKKFHHMGPHKKLKSLSHKDARLFETLVRILIQIIWLSLGRKYFNQIELEVNRVFKSEIFNIAEHKLHTDYVAKMSKEERSVLLGQCLKRDRLLKTFSPLSSEVLFCPRKIDYRIMGLGVIEYPKLPTRLQYLQSVLSCPEEQLQKLEVTVGILGLPRSDFDTMLRPLAVADKSKSKQAGAASRLTCSSSKSLKSRKSSDSAKKMVIYPDIILPLQEYIEHRYPASFPDDPQQIQNCSDTQRRLWQNRLIKLRAKSEQVTADTSKRPNRSHKSELLKKN